MNFLKSLLSYLGICALGVLMVIGIFHLKEIRECSIWEADPSLVVYEWQKAQCEALK